MTDRTAPRALVIEDEADIRRFLRLALESADIEVHEADSVQRGLIEAGTRRPDLLVLDLGLPDGDGIDLIRDLRGWSAVPVIVLSARGSEADKIAALDAGADDYLVKPFGTGELLARVRAHLRRQATPVRATEPRIRFGMITVDLIARTVRRADEDLHLTPIEYRLLTTLATRPDCVHTHRSLLQTVWGPGHADDTHYLRVHMANLRRKVEAEPSRPQHLRTETGIGYRFVP